jgi:hypothetical protein
MKDVYEVLIQKEVELSRVRREVEALLIAAPLLSGDDEADKPKLGRPIAAVIAGRARDN